eukprot:SAG22_NODE_1121_length_5508_cov_6.904234_4_plen_179_part_00
MLQLSFHLRHSAFILRQSLIFEGEMHLAIDYDIGGADSMDTQQLTGTSADTDWEEGARQLPELIKAAVVAQWTKATGTQAHNGHIFANSDEQVRRKALSFCCASTVFLSKTAPFCAVDPARKTPRCCFYVSVTLQHSATGVFLSPADRHATHATVGFKVGSKARPSLVLPLELLLSKI